jgi:hypothetical protein
MDCGRGVKKGFSLILAFEDRLIKISKIHYLSHKNTESTPFMLDTFHYNLDKRKSQTIETLKIFLVLVWIIERL